MRPSLAALAASVLIALLAPAPARAGDPVMALADVQAGMQCTGYSVVRGTDVSSFDVEILDVVDAAATGRGARILLQASGPAVDATGLGPGFSGSPVYCPDAAGNPSNVGAISEAIGEYGGKVVLATPIEAILGSPVDPPKVRPGASLRGGRRLGRIRSLASPLTVSGLAPSLGTALTRAAARRGRVVLAAPVGPLGSFGVQSLRPGSAFSVGYSNGDLQAGAAGTIAYTDQDRVWGFGHPFEGIGPRSLLLQDAYVFRVINNPIGVEGAITYKLAAGGHDLGTLTNDTLDAVTGRVGALPATIPVRANAKDLDAGTTRSVAMGVADESGVDEPSGGSPLAFLGPLGTLQAAGTVLNGSPARLTARGCFKVALRELRKPLRFCNRYVTDTADPSSGSAVAALAAGDLSDALAQIDAYKPAVLHVTGVDSSVQVRRGQRQAFLRAVKLPRRARAGQRVRATLVLRHVRGRLERKRVRLKLPLDLRPGRQRRVVFRGTDVDGGGGDFFDELIELFEEEGGGGDGLGPASVQELALSIEALERFDGVYARPPSDDEEDIDPGEPAYLDPDVRISGRASARLRVTRR